MIVRQPCLKGDANVPPISHTGSVPKSSLMHKAIATEVLLITLENILKPNRREANLPLLNISLALLSSSCAPTPFVSPFSMTNVVVFPPRSIHYKSSMTYA